MMVLLSNYQELIHKPLFKVITAIISSIVTLLFVANTLQAEIISKSADRPTIVNYLHKALVSDDYKKAAFLNATLAHEALQRSYTTLKAWENLRNPRNGLLPKDLSKNRNVWLPEDNAADLFPFLLIASKLLDPENEKLWLDTIDKERKICGPLPCAIKIQPTVVGKTSLSRQMFGASEYAKDGLLAISERFGKGPWFSRLEEIMQTVIEAAYIETKSGKISSSNGEVNGEMLQVLARLYWKTRKPMYLHMAEKIADAYLFEILPNNNYLPPLEWNFADKKTEDSKIRLIDHGSELIPGLVELYLLEKLQGRDKADLYQKEIKKFLDHILSTGRSSEGLWYVSVDNLTGEPLDLRFADTWGYILNSYKIFDIAEGTSIYTDDIKQIMKAVAALKAYPWEQGLPDGYADSIESMLYLLPWFDIPECHFWVDSEIGKMFNMQSPSGFIEARYLDGNFIRTALLYASYKTQGTMIVPWRNDVYFGAAYDKNRNALYVYLNAQSEWKGHLQFDIPRHRIFWNLPKDYPRLNSTPEWYTVDNRRSYKIINMNTGLSFTRTGNELAEGIPIHLNEKNPSLFLKISLIPVK
jgi:hypothetical protein